MNDLIAKLYDQSLIIDGNGDYVSGELDPVKFAELIVRECMNAIATSKESRQTVYYYRNIVSEHFGVE